jgi:tetratricopeptide (TPR) repeat protein
MILFKHNNTVLYLLLVLCIVSINNNLRAQTIDQGIKLIDLERYKDAKAAFESVAKNNPKDAPEAYYYLGELSIADSQITQALDDFNKGAEINQENPYSLVGLGHLKLISKDTVSAMKYFEDALDITDYEDVNIYLIIADAYIKSGISELSTPIDWLNKAKKLKNQKSNPQIYYKLAQIFLKLNNGTLARDNFQNAINYDNKFIRGYLGIADIYMRIKNYTDTESYLNEALKIDTNYTATYMALSDFYSTVKNYAKAAAAYKSYIDLSERTVDKLNKYSTLLYLAKDYKGAIDIIEEIEKGQYEDPQLTHILAYSFYSLQDTSKGIAAFEKYLSMVKPQEYLSTDFQYYGQMLAMAGKDSLAIVNYKKALSMDTTLTDLYGEIANLYFKDKNYNEAADEYVLKEQKTGKNLTLREYLNLGLAYMASKQFFKADSAFAKLTELKPDLPLGYLMRAAANSSIDSTSEQGLAKPYYEKFIQTATSSPDSLKYKKDLIDAYSYLGYFYFIKRDDPEYKDTWRQNYIDNWTKVLVLDPENVKAKNAMDNLKLIK